LYAGSFPDQDHSWNDYAGSEFYNYFCFLDENDDEEKSVQKMTLEITQVCQQTASCHYGSMYSTAAQGLRSASISCGSGATTDPGFEMNANPDSGLDFFQILLFSM